MSRTRRPVYAARWVRSAGCSVRPTGRRITDEETLTRIRKLAIPPAWTDVWICPSREGPPPGHRPRRARAQAVPLSPALARGARRDQVRPHDRVRARRSRRSAPRTERDLALPGLPREKVLATVVQLLEKTLIRVGNDEYAQQNQSFGLTTLRDRHVAVNGSTVRFEFRGKSGKSHTIDLRNRKLAAHRQALPRPARLRAVPVPRRGRRAAGDRLGGRERVPAGDHGRGLHREGLPHVGGHRARGAAPCASSPSETATEAKKNLRAGDRGGGRSARATPSRCAASATSTRRSSTAYLDRSLLETLEQRADAAIAESDDLKPGRTGRVEVPAEAAGEGQGGWLGVCFAFGSQCPPNTRYPAAA